MEINDSENIYSIYNTAKCGRFPVGQVDYAQSKQITILKKAANDIVFEEKPWATVLGDVMTNLRKNGRSYQLGAVRMIKTRLRRLVYKADIFNVHTNRYSKNFRLKKYRQWSDKKFKNYRLGIRRDISKNVKRYSSVRVILTDVSDVIAIPAVVKVPMEDSKHDSTEDILEDNKESTTYAHNGALMEWEKRRMIYEQQMHTGMIYLTPPASPVLNPVYTWNVLLDTQPESLSPLFSHLNN